MIENYGRSCFLLFVKTDIFLKRGNFYFLPYFSIRLGEDCLYTLRTRSVAMVMGTSSFSSHLPVFVGLKVRYCISDPYHGGSGRRIGIFWEPI